MLGGNGGRSGVMCEGSPYIHAWPDDGPACRELMQSILPLTEINRVGGVMVESAAYNPNRRAEWMFLGNEAHVEV